MMPFQPICRVPVACAVRMAALLLVLSGAGTLCGCAIAPPHVAITDQMIAEATEEAVRVEFLFEVSNPHDRTIELRELVYRLRIDNQRVYSGRRAARTTLSAQGSTEIFVPAVMDRDTYAALSETARRDGRFDVTGRLIYVTPGPIPQLLLDIGFPRPRVSFRHADAVARLVQPEQQ